MRLLLGDCLDKLKELDDNSIDSIVTDPPYGLSAAPNSGKSSKGGFMGKTWDYDVPSQEIWEECYRVLKPGGHLLSFAGSRTYHRMAVRIEDAGFEIRDQIMWIYGSGFPKSHNIGKAIDAMEKTGKSNPKAMREVRMGDDYKPTGQKDYKKGRMFGNDIENDNTEQTINNEWEGWGTALKPAHEPIVMARKPLSEKTVVDNVLQWGTGGINIDDSRIQHDEPVKTTTRTEKGDTWNDKNSGLRNNPSNMASAAPNGRFPANIIFDEEAGKILDEQSGFIKGDSRTSKSTYDKGIWGNAKPVESTALYNDSGGASRFFYCPKTSKKDRNEGLEHLEDKLTQGMRANAGPALVGDDESGRTTAKNNHPTVKPTDLMLYLIRMVTPKGGTTLDPFMGSGSTGKAAVRGGFDFVGIEREEEYMEIATARIEYEKKKPIIVETPAGKKVEVKKEVEEKVNRFFG